MARRSEEDIYIYYNNNYCFKCDCLNHTATMLLHDLPLVLLELLILRTLSIKMLNLAMQRGRRYTTLCLK